MIGIVTDLGYVNVIQRLIVHMSMWGKVCYFSSYSIIACSGAFNPVTPWWSLGLTRALTKLLCQLCLWYDENKQTAVGSLYCMSLGKCIYISFWLPCSCLFPLHSWSTSQCKRYLHRVLPRPCTQYRYRWGNFVSKYSFVSYDPTL